MESFLEKVVNHLSDKYGDNISELCIVLPNRRAGLFLKKHFSRRMNKTFFAPEIYSTEDFVSLLSDKPIADSITLLFELYEVIKTTTNKESEGFDEFSKWGSILLNDFNEIDNYLVDAKQLFGNVKDIKELETWSLNKENLTDFQSNYLLFYKSLEDYYNAFKERLSSKAYVYQGLANKLVSENVLEKVEKHNWKKIIFAGFNALNKAEERIIEKLVNAGLAEVIWDADKYYLNDTTQEAGKFIRKYIDSGLFDKHKEASIVIEETLLNNDKKEIHVIGTAKSVAQAKTAGSILSELIKTSPDLQNTAVVLADENLLFPVLHSLPDAIENINVTMGYPLRSTPFAGYIDLIVQLHESAIKLSKGKTNYSFYHTDIIKLLSHPYTAIALTDKGRKNKVKSVVNYIQERNIVFVTLNSLEKIFINLNCEEEFELLKPVFNHWTAPSDALTSLFYIIDILRNSISSRQENKSENKTNLELEYLFAFTKILNRLQQLMKDYANSVNDVKTFKVLVTQIVRSTTLPFYGEPLLGLQVMGMLETRTLDFENVILLSANEDILPSGKTTNSFIPYELKRHFGLPTYSDKDSVFGYHFYRLLQRANNIYLLYNTEKEILGSGEKSRYITQLMYELPKANKNVKILESLISLPVIAVNKSNDIIIKKTPHIIELLNEKAEYGFSPSLLNKFRKCSLQFYFSSIARLKEADEVEETIGADKMGSAIHKALETFYSPFVGKLIKAADIKKMKSGVNDAIIKAFEVDYSKNDISFGKNLLTISVAMKFINNFLDMEIDLISKCEKIGQPVIIKALEQELETVISIGSQEVKLKGNADRIDSVGKNIRIVDYKTGVTENKEINFKDWEEIVTNPELDKSFQLLMYALMYQRMNPSITENIISGIISFRKLSLGLQTVKIDSTEELSIDVLSEFEEQLKIILTDIFNPDSDFVQTDDLDTCEYCSFKGICNR